ncbi:unnamed protein product [Enterobius vermicularis]|uniref:DNA (Cytosine-5)-methyltransferase n=1 Tax=Enterobius vermicularis TaxID=51028 RepID=A0A0N4V7R5_ENTVE|nr:unnamed protein product [Enterobius vermicularis]
MEEEPLKCLEFFAGIGGFHYALKDGGLRCRVLAAFDINPVTNTIYQANFPDTKVYQKNIQVLILAIIKGVRLDLRDRRCDGLLNLCHELRNMRGPPSFVMVENVCGFETSMACDVLRKALSETGYVFEVNFSPKQSQLQEFILTPLQLGIPNSRPRYYLLAKLGGSVINSCDGLKLEFPEVLGLRGSPLRSIGEFVSLENDANENLKINLSSIIQHASALSYVARPSKRSACFTKSYSLFLKGCGSVFVTTPELQVEHPKEELLKLLVLFVSDSKQTSLSEPFGLRFFSWREVANLLGFPSDFHKPERITDKQMYRALGNSVSIFAVAALLKYLLECKGPYR